MVASVAIRSLATTGKRNLFSLPLKILAHMVGTLEAIAIAVVVAAVPVFFHFMRGTGWRPSEDISDAILEHRASTLAETDFPEPMSRAPGIGGGAIAAGGESAEGELEDAGAEESGPWTKSDDEAEIFEVEYVKEGTTVEVRENQTILEAGEEQGWELPYACREGQCLSCGGHVVDGPSEDFVIHNNQQMLESPELEKGYTLTCVAYPKADFSIETGETP